MNSNKYQNVRSMAPLRLGLAGGGTDVSPYSDKFGGCILNATLNLYAYTNIEVLKEEKVIFQSFDLNNKIEFSLTDEIPNHGDLPLHKGVYNRVMKDFNGGRHLPLKITTHSDAPIGSGLGSSSAMVVSILSAFVEMLKLPLGEYDVARLSYEIEREDLGMHGGKQDQYAATFGGFNFMEFFSDRVIVNPLRIRSDIISEIQYNLILYHLGTSRYSSEIIESQIQNVKSDKAKPIDAMHHLKDQALKQKEALLKGDTISFGKLLGYGWQYKKQMSEKITNTTIDKVYNQCMTLGALGVKVSGAGGGGFMMIYCNGDSKFKVMEGLAGFKGKLMNYQFVKTGTCAWPMQKE